MCFRNRPLNFITSERGDANVLGLFFTICVVLIFALAVDGAQGWSMRARLQTAADAAALAAAQHMETDLDRARSEAVAFVEHNLPPNIYGDVLRPEYVYFGEYKQHTSIFYEDETIPETVLVELHLNDARQNAIGTYFFGLLGQPSFEASAEALASPGDLSNSICGDDSLFLSIDILHISPGLISDGAHCWHSTNRLETNFNPNVYIARNGTQLSHPNGRNGIVGTLSSDSDPEDQVFVARDLGLEAYWQLPTLYSSLRTTLENVGDGNIYNGSDFPRTVTQNNSMVVNIIDGDWHVTSANEINDGEIYLVRADSAAGEDGNFIYDVAASPQTWNNVIILTDGDMVFGLSESERAAYQSADTPREFNIERFSDRQLNLNRVFLFAGAEKDWAFVNSLNNGTPQGDLPAIISTAQERSLQHRNFISMQINIGEQNWCDTRQQFNSYFLSPADFFWNEYVVSLGRIDGLYLSAYSFMTREVAWRMRGVYSETVEHVHFRGGQSEAVRSGGVVSSAGTEVNACPQQLTSDILPMTQVPDSHNPPTTNVNPSLFYGTRERIIR